MHRARRPRNGVAYHDIGKRSRQRGMALKKAVKVLLVIGLMVLTALLSVIATLFLTSMPDSAVDTDPVKAKMDEIGSYLDAYFIDEYDPEIVAAAAADGAAAAMIEATGAEWSYYISAEEMAAHVEQMENSYVGVGVTIQLVDNHEVLRIYIFEKY